MKFDDNHWYRDPSASAGTRIRLTGKSTDGRDSSTVGDIVFFFVSNGSAELTSPSSYFFLPAMLLGALVAYLLASLFYSRLSVVLR
jgi:hypothetical protein